MRMVRTGLQLKYQKEFCCANNYDWQVAVLWCCVQHSPNALCFMSGRKRTIPTKVPWLFSVLPDKHWVQVFLKWHKAGLANMRTSREVFAAHGHLNSFSDTV